MKGFQSKAWLALVLVSATSIEAWRTGIQAYRESRYPEALAAFQEAEGQGKEPAPAALLFNQALAAYQSQAWSQAESAALAAAARGGAEFQALADFLRGNIFYARCELAERESLGPQAGPSALDVAIALAQSAADAWQRAAMSREDWPQARRNVERALAKLEQLQNKKAAQPAPPAKKLPQAQPPENLDQLLKKLEAKKKSLRKRPKKAVPERDAVGRDW